METHYHQIICLTLAINVFFKKSFKISKHASIILHLLWLGFLDEESYHWIWILWPKNHAIKNNFKKFFTSLDSQDATNFVLTLFTLLILKSGKPLEVSWLWKWIGYLAMFQIVRKPDSFKKLICPLRVGLAPVSVILTWAASWRQIWISGFFSLQ